MSKLVTIFGGSGFVGRYIAQQLAMKGWRVRVAVRRPNEALHVRPMVPLGKLSQCSATFVMMRLSKRSHADLTLS